MIHPGFNPSRTAWPVSWETMSKDRQVNTRVARGREEVTELQRFLGSAVEGVHHAGQAVREYGQWIRVRRRVPLPRKGRRGAPDGERPLVHRQRLTHHSVGVDGVERIGPRHLDVVAERIRVHGWDRK